MKVVNALFAIPCNHLTQNQNLRIPEQFWHLILASCNMRIPASKYISLFEIPNGYAQFPVSDRIFHNRLFSMHKINQTGMNILCTLQYIILYSQKQYPLEIISKEMIMFISTQMYFRKKQYPTSITSLIFVLAGFINNNLYLVL